MQMGPRPSGLTPFKSGRRNLLHSHVAPIVVAMVMAMLDLCRRNSRPTWMSTALSASGLPSPSPSPLPQSPILETQSQLQSRFYGKVGSGSTDDLLRNATAPTAPRCASVNCKSGLTGAGGVTWVRMGVEGLRLCGWARTEMEG